MIAKESYQSEWIHSVAERLGKRGDPKILEKVIYAFTLLEQLRVSGLELIFKGGTSLLLLNDHPRRFSIDIDIITPVRPEDIPHYLNKVIQMNVFSKWAEDKDRKHGLDIPMSHYKFYYTSKIGSKYVDEPILLDVLFNHNPYPQLIAVPLKHHWLKTTEPLISVNIPSIESIIGDKLTAFAPTTTGILYSKNRPVEIIKQLYDIAFLFDLAVDMALVKSAYKRVVNDEIIFRKLNTTWEAVLEDSFQACIDITERDVQKETFRHLQKGISNIVNFILEKFHLEEAIICAAKTAYLITIIRTENPIAVRYTQSEQIRELVITHPSFTKFNKLKKSSPEAFFYWHHVLL